MLQWNEMENALRATKEREDAYKSQKDMLESKIKHKMEMIGILEREKDDVDRENARLDNEIKIVNGRAAHFQRAYQETENKKQSEIDILTNEIQTSTMKEKEILNKYVLLEKESEDLREHTRSYKRELDINRQEFENMMRVMEDLESKVNK